MKMTRCVMRGIGGVVLMTLTMLSLQTPASAGMVGTGAVIAQQQIAIDRGQLLSALNRDEVREQLVAMGVDPQAARERVAALSDAELQAVAGNVQTLPAGGDGILGVAVLIFLVLLFTDIMGYTHIFPFVKKTVH